MLLARGLQAGRGVIEAAVCALLAFPAPVLCMRPANSSCLCSLSACGVALHCAALHCAVVQAG